MFANNTARVGFVTWFLVDIYDVKQPLIFHVIKVEIRLNCTAGARRVIKPDLKLPNSTETNFIILETSYKQFATRSRNLMYSS